MPTATSLKEIEDNPNTKWTVINLNHQKIGDQGAVALAECLKNHSQLQLLSLHTNQIGKAGTKALKNLKNSKLNLNLGNQDSKTIIFPVKGNKIPNKEMLKLHDLIKEGSNLGQHKSEKAILLLGKTGAGKSTLANLLLGRKLKATEDEDTDDLVINTIDSTNIAVSNDRVSETKLPNRGQVGNTAVWDCPGFKDTCACCV